MLAISLIRFTSGCKYKGSNVQQFTFHDDTSAIDPAGDKAPVTPLAIKRVSIANDDLGAATQAVIDVGVDVDANVDFEERVARSTSGKECEFDLIAPYQPRILICQPYLIPKMREG